MNNANDDFEKLIRPFEVMAGGLYSKKCVEAVAQWAFLKSIEIAKGYPKHWIQYDDKAPIKIAKDIQQYAKEISNERRPRLH